MQTDRHQSIRALAEKFNMSINIVHTIMQCMGHHKVWTQ